MYTLVLIRHGESILNKQNRFAGWTNIELTKKGVQEAIDAGKLLKKKGYKFDVVFTSFLVRATHTTLHVLDAMKEDPLIIKSWRLNEKHYGMLQGMNRAEMSAQYGEEKVHAWRRVYDCRPPALKTTDKRHPLHDPLYKEVKKSLLPSAESLKDTVARVLPFWKTYIAPTIKQDSQVLISAHGNSLRAIVKHLDRLSDKAIADLNIPTGIPLVYELNEQLKPIRHYYLGDRKKIKKMIDEVKNQEKPKKK